MPAVARSLSVSRRPMHLASCLGMLMLTLGASPLLPADSFAQGAPGGGARSDSGAVYAEMWMPRTSTGALHLHGGVYAPIDANATSATIGARLGVNMGNPVLFGVMVDWVYNSKSLLEPVDSSLPGFEPETELANVQAHLVPAMLFLQVAFAKQARLVPYVGLGAGYEWLVLHAKDYRTAADSSVTYGNWAWQWYAGMGLRVSSGVRVDGEVFYNDGSL